MFAFISWLTSILTSREDSGAVDQLFWQGKAGENGRRFHTLFENEIAEGRLHKHNRNKQIQLEKWKIISSRKNICSYSWNRWERGNLETGVLLDESFQSFPELFSTPTWKKGLSVFFDRVLSVFWKWTKTELRDVVYHARAFFANWQWVKNQTSRNCCNHTSRRVDHMTARKPDGAAVL